MTGEEKEELFQEALSSANVLSRRLERILKALNERKTVAREDTVFLGKIAKGLETTLKELFE
jgi:hypothetical protein